MQTILYTLFLCVYILNIFYILKEDLETKYIPLVWFYPFVILSGVYYYIQFQSIIWASFLLLYLGFISILDMIEYFKWPIASIGEKWKFLDTWIYDYFLYIFISDLVISDIVTNFWTISFLFDFWIVFIATLVVWMSFLIFHQKKVNILIYKSNIETFEALDTALYERKLNTVSYKEIFWKQNIVFNTEQEKLLQYYKQRVPLFLFGNIFIFSFIVIKII